MAGDANLDEFVDGQDAVLLSAALGSHAGGPGYGTALDANQDGTVDGSVDSHLLDANFGFTPNRPPMLTAGQALTHTNLPVVVSLASLAHDPDGDPVTGASSRRGYGPLVNADGFTVTFVPDSGYFGRGQLQLHGGRWLQLGSSARDVYGDRQYVLESASTLPAASSTWIAAR